MSQKKKELETGARINIKRSDGRIHTAFVGSINYDIGSASVEWFEQGETKGKEIDLLLIEALNPDIRIIRPTDNGREQLEEPVIRSTNNRREQSELRQPEEPIIRSTELRQAQEGIIRNDSCGSSEEETSAGAMAQSGKLEESDDDFNSNLFSVDTAIISDPLVRRTMGTFALQPSPTQYHLASNGHAASGSTVPKEREKDHPRLTDARKASVVREVEKLKRNREERRQRQAEEKAEKEAFLQMHPENPHWELISKIQEYRRTLEIKPLSENDAIEDHLITVCVRKRPLNKKEINRKEVDVITIPSKNQLIVHEPKNKVDLTKYLENQLFRFDYAFDETCSNEMVYRYTAQPLIKTIFDGGFATCFAYGQTGSGKTHTMGGSINGKTQDCHKGIYALVTADVFKLIMDPRYRHLKLAISSSFFEIYSGKVFDLLNSKAKLKILEDGKQQVQVVGLSEIAVHSTEEVLKLIQKGSQARTSGQTFANNNSSRSHAVFQIFLRSMSAPEKIHGKFSLIDLAGNERGADTSSANRQTRMEGAEINKSLLALKECIRALARKGAHLPFRVSKLTQVLRDSFVGSNSRTCMIAMVSPGVSSCEYTLNTLRYADRVKELGGGDLQTAQLSDDQENADLVQLQSLNEAEMSPELLNLHQAISELQIAEDIMLDNYKQTFADFASFADKGNKILESADSVTYDQEAMCNNLIDWANNVINVLQRSKESAEDFKAKLLAEEQLSFVTKRKKNTHC